LEFDNDLGLFYTYSDFCMHNSINNPLRSGKKLLTAHSVYPVDHTVSGIGQRFILY